MLCDMPFFRAPSDPFSTSAETLSNSRAGVHGETLIFRSVCGDL